MRLAVVVLILGASDAAFGQSPARAPFNADSIGQLPTGFAQQARDFGRFQPGNFREETIVVNPPPGPSQAGRAKVEPIPTQWPNVKVESIPTQWAGLNMVPIDAGKPSPKK